MEATTPDHREARQYDRGRDGQRESRIRLVGKKWCVPVLRVLRQPLPSPPLKPGVDSLQVLSAGRCLLAQDGWRPGWPVSAMGHIVRRSQRYLEALMWERAG